MSFVIWQYSILTIAEQGGITLKSSRNTTVYLKLEKQDTAIHLPSFPLQRYW
jgi:hypothetical protein